MSGQLFAIVVNFKLKAGAAEDFMPVILENAEASVRDEPGCQQFQVLHEEDSPETIVLYEVYDDEAAFEAHKQTPHFAKFDQEGLPLVEQANIQRCSLLKA